LAFCTDSSRITAPSAKRLVCARSRRSRRYRAGWCGKAASTSDAIAALGARCDQRLDGGDDADADDHHFGRQQFAVGQPHAGGAIVALDRIDLGTPAAVDAMRAMLFFVEARQRLAGDAREHAIERFEQHDLLARLVSTAAASSPI
jgi:hypothetical protein